MIFFNFYRILLRNFIQVVSVHHYLPTAGKKLLLFFLSFQVNIAFLYSTVIYLLKTIFFLESLREERNVADYIYLLIVGKNVVDDSNLLCDNYFSVGTRKI